MAEETISAATVIGFLCEEPPVNWDPAGVSQNGFDHTPRQKYKQHVEDNEQDDVGGRLEVEHVLKDENEVVEGDEDNDSDEVGVEQLAAAHLAITHQLLEQL